MNLNEVWLQNVKEWGCDEASGERVFSKIRINYEKTNRYYHNFSHIKALLRLFKEYESEIVEPNLVSMAIWFHDLVYHPLSKKNEIKSARLAGKLLNDMGVSCDVQQRVSEFILQTAYPIEKLRSKDRDLAWFLDFDLSILGAAPDEYARYAEAVRKEYRIIPESFYRLGRMKILRQFLEQDFIYKTAPIRRQLEKQARSNVLKELKFWEVNL